MVTLETKRATFRVQSEHVTSGQGQRMTTVARKAPVFGKMLKYYVRACVILESGASGLTVGVEITKEARKCKREEHGKNASQI